MQQRRRTAGAAAGGEPASDDNRVALRITGTKGVVSAASFPVPDCVAATPEAEACMALSAALPRRPAARRARLPAPRRWHRRALRPGRAVAPVGDPTSLPLDATAVVGPTTININTITGALVMRLREAADGPAMGYDPAPGLVFQAGLDAYITRSIYARLDVKFIAFMLARAEVQHVNVKTPGLPLFDSVEVGTAKMSVWVNPFIVQAGLGFDFDAW